MALAAAHIVPGNTLTAVISVPWQQQLQHDLRLWCGEIGTSAWDSRSSSKPKKTTAECLLPGNVDECSHPSWSELQHDVMMPFWSHWFVNSVPGVLHSPFQVFFSLPHLDLASFLGGWNWRGTSWSTGRLGGRGATWGCNSSEHLGYSLVMSGILWHFILILWYLYIIYIIIFHGITKASREAG